MFGINSLTLAGTVLAVAALIVRSVVAARLRRRDRKLKHTEERVLVLGASSGVGREITKQYAARGAKVCAVARRAENLKEVAEECGPNCIWEAADFTVPEDMVRVRERLLKEWGGVDTLQICGGVSALQPIMDLTEVKGRREEDDVPASAIHTANDTANRAIRANFNGPYISAVAFIPVLLRTSPSPAILLLNSVASVVPAPTRALYAASKASSLLLYQALAIEHPGIMFTMIIPSTIAGDFRTSAVDRHLGGPHEMDPDPRWLKIGPVATKCIDLVDRAVHGNIFVPWLPYVFGHFMYYYLSPSWVEEQARRKYRF